MVIKKEDMEKYVRSNMRGGNGDIGMTTILPVDKLCGKGRGFNIMTMEPGTSCGLHDHNGEFEIYYILKGEVQGMDSGVPVRMKAGDVMYCGNGENHSVENVSDETAEILAVILFD